MAAHRVAPFVQHHACCCRGASTAAPPRLPPSRAGHPLLSGEAGPSGQVPAREAAVLQRIGEERPPERHGAAAARARIDRGMELRSRMTMCSTGPSSSPTKTGTWLLLLRCCRDVVGEGLTVVRCCSSAPAPRAATSY
ncbi:unnamed protein product [Urochloa humidicola]